MKDLGEVDVILNIKLVKESNGGVTLTQSHYVEKILSCFGYSDYKPTNHFQGLVVASPAPGNLFQYILKIVLCPNEKQISSKKYKNLTLALLTQIE